MWAASRRDFLIALVLQLTPGVLIGVQVLLTRNALSALLKVDRDAAPSSTLVAPLVLLAVVSAVAGGCLLAYQQQQRILGEVVQREVWRRILHVTASVELASFEDPAFFDQFKRVEHNAVTRPVQVTQSAVQFLGGLLGSIGVTIALIALQPLLLPLLLLAAVPLVIFARRGARSEFGFVVEQTPIHRERLVVQELLTERDPAKELRAFGLRTVLRERWHTRYSTYLDALRRQVRLRIRLSLLGSGLAALVVAGSGGLLVGLVAAGRMSVADAGAAAVAARALASRAGQSVRGSGTLAESSLFLADLRAFLERADVPSPVRGSATAPQGFQTLRVEDVSFAYPSSRNTAVSHVELEIRAGEVIALVGENGSGKTTLAKLLARLYEPDSGRICWDDQDIAVVDPEELRRHIAVVFQEFVRYPLPARENISLGWS